jgi:hypothetical protein
LRYLREETLRAADADAQFWAAEVAKESLNTTATRQVGFFARAVAAAEIKMADSEREESTALSSLNAVISQQESVAAASRAAAERAELAAAVASADLSAAKIRRADSAAAASAAILEFHRLKKETEGAQSGLEAAQRERAAASRALALSLKSERPS